MFIDPSLFTTAASPLLKAVRLGRPAHRRFVPCIIGSKLVMAGSRGTEPHQQQCMSRPVVSMWLHVECKRVVSRHVQERAVIGPNVRQSEAQMFILSRIVVSGTIVLSQCSCKAFAWSAMAFGKQKQGAKGAKRGGRKKCAILARLVTCDWFHCHY
jgi:hypothetical protein